MRRIAFVLVVIVAVVSGAVAFGQRARVVVPLADDSTINYSGPSHDPVAALNREIEAGRVQLKFNGESGYLRSVLDALNVPVESQMAVFARTSVQAGKISPQSPRALFFNDSVVVGWVPGGFIELAAEDPQQGVIFYALGQGRTSSPKFVRQDQCLGCHATADAAGAPGMIVRSHFANPNGTVLRQLGFFDSDHRSPLSERWGGWYVTGNTGAMAHLGNVMVTDPDRPKAGQTLNLESLAGKFDTTGYLSPYSDIVALMVFEHQMHTINLLTRMGWQTRYTLSQRDAKQQIPNDLNAGLGDTARELVDYMLFIDEAPLTNRIRGTSGFSEAFAERPPRDSQGRSLHQLDLERRLMKYPCSYMIYSSAFDALPSEAKGMIYRRMWQILSGEVKGGKYNRLAVADRQAIVGILQETKTDLPNYFRAATTRAKEIEKIASLDVGAVVPLGQSPAAQAPGVVRQWQFDAGGKMAFDVASVKPNPTAPSPQTVTSNFPLGPGDMYRPNGGLFRAINQPLLAYIAFAYKMDTSQLQRLAGELPSWVLSSRYDIEARVAGDPTKDQMRLMMQALLADRFKLAMRREARPLPIFALVLDKPGKLGPQLKPYPDGVPCDPTASAASLTAQGLPTVLASGFPAICGGYAGMPPSVPGRIHVGARNVTIQIMADQFPGSARAVDRPVFDKTGLTGTYDFAIEYAPSLEGLVIVGNPPPIESSGPTFLQALKEQLGLKLDAQTGPVDVFVVDHVEQPTEN